jgi:predicted dehydrogenase
VRFGLLGTGYWARHTHGPALATHPRVQLAGVWGRCPGKASALADELGCRSYTHVAQLFADVDVVAIALPPDTQATLAVQAAMAGRHLLLDKPLALSVAAADRVVTAVQNSDVASVVFFTRRFDPLVATALADASAAGGWYGGRATIFSANFAPGSPYAASPWRRQYGGLWDIGPHALCRLLPVLGPVTAVTAFAGRHDTACVMLRHDDGAVSEMAISADAPAAAKLFETVLYGSSGVLVLPGGSVDYVTAYHRAVDELLTQIDTAARDHACDARFARDVVATLAAADAAIHQQRVVTIGATEPLPADDPTERHLTRAWT